MYEEKKYTVVGDKILGGARAPPGPMLFPPLGVHQNWMNNKHSY